MTVLIQEPIFFKPVIPTTSLFLMEELVGDKLDGYIHRIEGKGAIISHTVDDTMPYKWLKYKEKRTPKLALFYDRKRNSEEPFGLPLTVEKATELGVPEIWIRKIILHIIDHRWKERNYTFVNKPVTLGSQAEAASIISIEKGK